MLSNGEQCRRPALHNLRTLSTGRAEHSFVGIKHFLGRSERLHFENLFIS
jgi:hypothetical protein